MLNNDEFAYLVALDHERRDVEFKPPGPRTEPHLFAQVTRAALGMANNRGGGVVIIGVSQQGAIFRPIGLSNGDVASWRYDDVASRFAVYADPYIDFDLAVKDYEKRQFIVLQISEFAELPVLCKDEYQLPAQPGTGSRRVMPPLLRKGACYVRSRRKPETVEVPSQSEMRELLDLAIDKGVRRFVERARAAGLDLSAASSQADQPGYDRELRDTEGS